MKIIDKKSGRTADKLDPNQAGDDVFPGQPVEIDLRHAIGLHYRRSEPVPSSWPATSGLSPASHGLALRISIDHGQAPVARTRPSLRT